MQDLTPKQEKAVAALLSEPSVTAAAAKVGLAERTLYGWLADPAFAEAYRAARRAAVSQAVARLQQFSSHATTVLLQLMDDRSVSSSVRLRAAIAVLEFAIRAVELEDLQQRVEALEQAYKERKP